MLILLKIQEYLIKNRRKAYNFSLILGFCAIIVIYDGGNQGR